MPNVISVSSFDEVDVKEDQKNEFKTSIFFDPENHAPGFKQMQAIAETLAAFMNAEGGMLYVGVTDDKRVVGIANDLDVLNANPAAIARAFLSPNAREYLGGIIVAPIGGKPVCRVEVKPCRPDDYVYTFCKYRPTRPEVAEIYVRAGNQTNKLEGEARDRFVRERTRRQVLANVQAVNAQNADGLVARIVEAINTGFGPAVIGGAPVQVEGAVALDDPHFGALPSPKGLVFDGAHVCDVKGWKGAYEALLRKLNEIDAAKFDELPEADYFRKFFVAVQRNRRYPGFFTGGLGSASNIRAKEVSNKEYFIRPTYVVHRLLAHFGIEPGRVAVRG